MGIDARASIRSIVAFHAGAAHDKMFEVSKKEAIVLWTCTGHHHDQQQ